jgi:tRNA(adenine34) deaminase
MWNSLARPWLVCLEEAWAAFCAGSLPIGACVTDNAGNILSRGRNRIADVKSDAPYVFNNTLAHAELNALLALQADHETRHTSALFTTTEPCPLCLGAFYMSGVRNMYYAAREPYAGSTNLLGTTPYLSRKPIHVFAPPDSTLETMVTALYVERDMVCGHSPQNIVLQALREVIPQGIALGEQLHRSGELRWMQAEAWAIEQVVDTLSQMINL